MTGLFAIVALAGPAFGGVCGDLEAAVCAAIRSQVEGRLSSHLVGEQSLVRVVELPASPCRSCPDWMRHDAIRAVWTLQLSVRDEPLELWTVHDAHGLLDASNDLPDCTTDASQCDLHIDAPSAIAIAIASTEGTPLGTPTAELVATRREGIAWQVAVENEARPGSGVSLYVHAATGETSGLRVWFVAPARPSDRTSK